MKTVNKTIASLIVGCVFACCFAQKIQAQMPPGGGGGGGTNSSSPSPDISNYLKYQAQSFLVLDTNAVAATDTNLFSALSAFSNDNGTNPVLQVMPYQGNCLLFKASHFDYSGESTRDFCLAVCDKVETPLYKNIDLSTPSNNVQNGGWLVQGSIPSWKVADPMFLMVSNTSRIYNGFFRIIPYVGPEITLTGPQPYDTVSNTISFQATISDISGITNEQFVVTVDGAPARYSIGASNTISLETKYNPNGSCTVWANTINTALIVDPTNLPDNAKLYFSGSGTLPLDFENDTYMAFASDNASPSIGVNYFLFVINKAQNIDATIFDPSNGQVVAHYAGYVPYAATIELPWGFTESDGVTAYSNDTYVVTFTAFDQTTLTITNHIDRHGVRVAAANIGTYEEEDPSLSGGSHLNSEANLFIGGMEITLYGALYDNDFLSTTLYYTSDIGANRDNPSSPDLPFVLTSGSEQTWANNTLLSLENLAFSDFNFYMGHGNGAEIGGGPKGSTFVKSYLDATTAGTYAAAPAHNSTTPNWRMRKVTLWACYSDTDFAATAGGVYPTWHDAFGIRNTIEQNCSFMMKNVGLFFGGGLPQTGYSGTYGNTSVEVAADLDYLWVAGPNDYPGGCDPTYAFSWAVSQIRGMNPELDTALPAVIGFQYLNYAGVYDGELTTNDVEHVKR
jgi:hypothetical protein